jgi:hypothetical protein
LHHLEAISHAFRTCWQQEVQESGWRYFVQFASTLWSSYRWLAVTQLCEIGVLIPAFILPGLRGKLPGTNVQIDSYFYSPRLLTMIFGDGQILRHCR